MNRRLLLPVLLALAALAALPAAASAGWFPAGVNAPIDGPSPDIVGMGGVDLARDGTGGLVYLKRVDGAPHVFLSRFNGGAFRPPERVDVGIGEGASEAAITATDADRLAIVWAAGGKLFGSVVVGNDQAPGPLLGPTLLYDAGAGTVSDVAVDMGINGTGYATFASVQNGQGDLRAVRLTGTTWEGIAPSLDIAPAQSAGRGPSQRSRVGVSAEGNALVVWGENSADGRPRAFARRLTGLTPSAAPQELSIPDLGGAPGGRADSPDVDIEDDGSFAWAVFRQDFAGGSRSVARRMLGSTFDPPLPLDGGPGTSAPRIAINGRGQGLATLQTGGVASGSVIYNDVLEGTFPLSSQPGAGGAEPLPASSEHREVILAWRLDGSIRARMKPEPTKAWDPEIELSRPDLGPVAPGQFAVAADRLAGFAVAMVQGDPGGNRSVTVALQDRLPGRPGAIARSAWQSGRRAKLEWRPGRDLWGPQRFRVVVGGRVVGETTGTSLVPSQRLAAGRPIKYQVIAIDARGQQSPSRTRRVRFDNDAPRFNVRIIGKRRAGRALRIVVRPKDKGSGVRVIKVRYDSRTVVRGRKRFVGRHVYRRGSHTLKVTVYDVAGNRRIKKVKVRVT